ncbi:MAG: hypothetical protein V4458_05990 [Pseudomonadota bacterium]
MNILGGGDDFLVSRIRADLSAYKAAMQHGDTDACIVIEKRYGLYGLSPKMVTDQMFDMIAQKPLTAGRAS